MFLEQSQGYSNSYFFSITVFILFYPLIRHHCRKLIHLLNYAPIHSFVPDLSLFRAQIFFHFKSLDWKYLTRLKKSVLGIEKKIHFKKVKIDVDTSGKIKSSDLIESNSD